MRTSRLPINMAEQLAVRPGNQQLEPGRGPPVAALENPAAPVVRGALVVLENPAVRAALVRRVAAPVRQVAAAPVRRVEAALVRQVAAALVRQVGVAEKEAETRSVAISRRAAVAVAPLVAGRAGSLLKPRAAGVAVA